MHALSIRFRLPSNTDWDATRQLMHQRAALYSNVDGLISKAFLLNPRTGEYGGNYVWESSEAARAFLSSELFQGAVRKFGQPVVSEYEVVAYLEHGAMVAQHQT